MYQWSADALGTNVFPDAYAWHTYFMLTKWLLMQLQNPFLLIRRGIARMSCQ
jgi:hypothetical protein